MTPTRASSPSPDRRLLAAATLLVVVVVAIYSPVRHADFLALDDTVYVTENPYVRSGLTADGIRHAMYGSRGGLWMPLSFLSHMVDVELFGLRPAGPHLVNIALHAVNVVLLLWLLVRATGAFAPSVAVAALFALHPLRVESVAWIAERKDVLSTCFGLLALHAWVSWVHRPGLGRYLLVVVATAAALLSKPMLVSLPLLFLLVDVWPLGRLTTDGGARATPWRLALEKVPLLFLAGAAAAVTLASARAGGAMVTLGDHPFPARIAHATVSYVWYAWKTVWPVDLGVFYPYRTWAPWQVAGAATLLCAGGAGALAAWRRAPWITIGVAWFAITLFPVIGLFQAGSQGMADRFTYVPSIGFFVAVVWSLDDLARSARARATLAAAAAVVVAAFAVASARQLTHWRDGLALYEHTLTVTAGNWMIETEVGNVFLERGEAERAYAHFEEAYRIEPRYPKAAFGLGLAAAALGRQDEAEAHYRNTIRIDRGYARAHNNLGILLFGRHDTDGALHHLSEAVRFAPDSTEIVANLRFALTEVGFGDVDGYVAQLSTWSSAVAADRDRPGGATYGPVLMRGLLDQRFEAVRGCIGQGGGGPPAPFNIYVAVAADGTLADVAALPPTRAARCFGEELRTARAPAPPFAPFHAQVSMQFGG